MSDPVAPVTAPAPAAGYTIHVSGLAPETSEEKLHDFFSFCGKLVSVKKTGETAEITFEKLSAMRTSLMLNGGTLDGAHLEVTSTTEEPKSSVLPTGTTGSTPIGAGVVHDLTQEDKPKAAIVAEYLAHGYVLGDHIVQRAIDFDHQQGISHKVLDFFGKLDKTVGNRVIGQDKTVSAKLNEHAAFVMAKTKEVDQQRGVSSRLHEYYQKTAGTSIGSKFIKFYTDTQKQVLDVHEEARRIADDKKRQSVTPPTTGTAEPAAAPVDAKPAEATPVIAEPGAALL
ncbi:hypothetical protein TREMEDRAFT_70704 [Tremella mesenterica DSM 1558]|uniref:uncharacterized protein n=1 Tax=Tremella mesenterica (strain ATCC 24925 / CBS 8224 / DSM 1558 / NBRC 9311 / NRRL Y-6157 / RJB 2259-6 / UBC 559-6) TaxID=578456 RepID=UPI0003F4A2AE|nr:uncharacterized protein TREMEDRAFT_70704 [Tremella mesenterica DSM 1558]EIW72379.1 hypothetical protein TREMEDRAFT_70704 [Tremella mesenterica DSM 1558]